jgi:hypothetical protein
LSVEIPHPEVLVFSFLKVLVFKEEVIGLFQETDFVNIFLREERERRKSLVRGRRFRVNIRLFV